MRILHCTDFHCNEKWFEWLIRESVNFDLVCLTGDLLDLSPDRQLAGQIDLITSMLHRISVPLAVCSGNHDSLAGGGVGLEHAAWLQDLRSENVWVDGDRFELDGFKLQCVAWLALELAAQPDEIWLIHAPPDQAPTGVNRGGMDFGDFTLGEVCRAGMGPWLALSGHIHNPQSWQAKVGRTWSLNPGCTEKSEVPNHIMIDLVEDMAVLHRASGEVDAIQLCP